MKKTSAGKKAKYIKLAIKLAMLATAPATLTNCPPPVGPEVPPVNPPTQPTTPHEHEFGGAYIADGANGHYQLCQIDHTTRSAVEPHIAGEWITDSEPAMGRPGSKHIECTVCGYEMQREQIAEIPHQFGGQYYSAGENGHYQLCQVDHTTRSPIQAHQLNQINVRPIINYADGLIRLECTQCDYKKEETISPYVVQSVENIYFNSNTVSSNITAATQLRLGATELKKQAQLINSQYNIYAYTADSTFAGKVSSASANFAAYMNAGGEENGLHSFITDYNNAVMPAIKNLFGNTADGDLFINRLKAFRLAHYTNQRQFDGMYAPSTISGNLSTLNTNCNAINIPDVTGTTITKDNINAAIGKILLTLKETLPYDKAGIPGLNLLQQFEDTAQFEALMDDIRAKGLVVQTQITKISPKLQQNTVNPGLEQEENLYYVEERRRLQEAAGLYV